jgi:hypothetical protein
MIEMPNTFCRSAGRWISMIMSERWSFGFPRLSLPITRMFMGPAASGGSDGAGDDGADDGVWLRLVVGAPAGGGPGREDATITPTTTATTSKRSDAPAMMRRRRRTRRAS